MQAATLFLLCAVIAGALAGGQYYVPRAYYVIDAEGHESIPVPLHRLRRSLYPSFPSAWGSGDPNGANANANAHANAYAQGGGSANANADANANAFAGGWGAPGRSYGASRPLRH